MSSEYSLQTTSANTTRTAMFLSRLAWLLGQLSSSEHVYKVTYKVESCLVVAHHFHAHLCPTVHGALSRIGTAVLWWIFLSFTLFKRHF